MIVDFIFWRILRSGTKQKQIGKSYDERSENVESLDCAGTGNVHPRQ
jgi:hypothetical protein